MKLKTLKDLDMYKTHKKLLKREAIKWVKGCDCKVLRCVACMRFVVFFNITEEDLK